MVSNTSDTQQHRPSTDETNAAPVATPTCITDTQRAKAAEFLEMWASMKGEFDHLVYVGKNITKHDIKLAIREILWSSPKT